MVFSRYREQLVPPAYRMAAGRRTSPKKSPPWVVVGLAVVVPVLLAMIVFGGGEEEGPEPPSATEVAAIPPSASERPAADLGIAAQLQREAGPRNAIEVAIQATVLISSRKDPGRRLRY